MNDFERCTITKHKLFPFPRSSIECRLGLWRVDGPYNDDLVREAWHYFIQYKSDGEYDKLLGVVEDEEKTSF